MRIKSVLFSWVHRATVCFLCPLNQHQLPLPPAPHLMHLRPVDTACTHVPCCSLHCAFSWERPSHLASAELIPQRSSLSSGVVSSRKPCVSSSIRKSTPSPSSFHTLWLLSHHTAHHTKNLWFSVCHPK